MIKRREFLAGAAAVCAAPSIVRAQGKWPEKPITLVVPFGAGGSADLVGRMFAQQFQAKRNATVVVEDRSGAGGSLGTGYVAKAAPDGYTLLLGTVSTHAINPALYAKLPFNVETDFEPITPIVRLPNLLAVNKNVPAKNMAELIDYLKANSGKLNFGSSGNGTSGHLSTVMLMKAIGVTMTHVPFRSMTDEMSSLVGGHIDLCIDSMTVLWPQVKSGEIRAIGVTTPQRAKAAPDVPTIGETVKGYAAVGWQGLYAPAKTPKPIVEMIAADVKEIFTRPDMIDALNNLGGEPMPMAPDDFAKFAAAERVKWGEVVKESGVRIE